MDVPKIKKDRSNKSGRVRPGTKKNLTSKEMPASDEDDEEKELTQMPKRKRKIV